MGYHRLLTHRGYKVPRYFEYFLAICGTLALEGGPIPWVATHRVHHQFSDLPAIRTRRATGAGGRTFCGCWTGDPTNANTAECARYAPDLAKDPFYVWLSRYHWVPLTLLGLVLLAVGGIPFVLWGIFFARHRGPARDVDGQFHHPHLGLAPVCTPDDSRNNWFVALLSFGEGWHTTTTPIRSRPGTAGMV